MRAIKGRKLADIGKKEKKREVAGNFCSIMAIKLPFIIRTIFHEWIMYSVRVLSFLFICICICVNALCVCTCSVMSAHVIFSFSPPVFPSLKASKRAIFKMACCVRRKRRDERSKRPAALVKRNPHLPFSPQFQNSILLHSMSSKRAAKKKFVGGQTVSKKVRMRKFKDSGHCTVQTNKLLKNA